MIMSFLETMKQEKKGENSRVTVPLLVLHATVLKVVECTMKSLRLLQSP
jgi:hypothetical protein